MTMEEVGHKLGVDQAPNWITMSSGCSFEKHTLGDISPAQEQGVAGGSSRRQLFVQNTGQRMFFCLHR